MSQQPSQQQGCISVIEELVALRAQVHQGKSLRELLGAVCLKELVAFEVGYGMCGLRNGCRDVETAVFWEWLRSKGEYGGDWTTDYLELCGGSHDKAMMRLLDFMAEYLELRKHQPLEYFPPPLRTTPDDTPRATPKHYVSLLDVWMADYPEIKRGRPLWLLFGHETLPTVACYALGYTRCCERHGFPDVRWQSFLRWLCQVERLPAEGWAPQMLEHYGMDHHAAIYRLLDRVAEFVGP
jgi:hypothetical protein